MSMSSSVEFESINPIPVRALEYRDMGDAFQSSTAPATPVNRWRAVRSE